MCEGFPRQSEEVPAHQTEHILTKRLVVNADDFGFTRDVNAGIVEAHRRG
ncbi:MAG: ChbG/HpnK family deacetylase, partial [Bryobacteraceae bacterium]